MGSMPTKFAKVEATPKVSETFEQRKRVVGPGQIFLSPDTPEAIVVLQFDGQPFTLHIPTDGSAPTWILSKMDAIGIPDSWTLHRIDHVNFQYNLQEL